MLVELGKYNYESEVPLFGCSVGSFINGI